MPDFEARITSTVTVAIWKDPATNDAPSRLNPMRRVQHRYLRITPPETVTAKATVDGVEEPLDAALGGRLFQVHFAEWSGSYPPPIAQTSGQSSVATFDVTTDHLGHFALVFRRPSGGAVVIHFDVEAPPAPPA